MHFGHYISGSVHVGILSWLLVGSWFVPPESAPFESVSVAMISNAEFAAMTMSDESPEAAQFTSQVVIPSEQEEFVRQMPNQIQSISPAAEIDMIAIKESPEIQPQTPKPLRVPSPSFAENMPNLTIPSENDFALLKSPEVIDAPQTANRISTLAIAPPPPDLQVDDQLLEAALPPEIVPLPVEEKPKEEDVTSTTQIETAVEITPKISKEKPAAPEVSLRPQSTIEILQNIEPPEELAETPEDSWRTSAPQISVRPKARSEREKPAPTQETNKPEPSTELSAQVNSAVNSALKQAVVSSLTAQQEGEIRSTVQNAMRPYWRVLPGSPASNVILVVRLEFDETGTVKKDSIDLISSEGGNQKAVRTAFRAAKTAIKRASLDEAFKLPAETFDGWKVLELEFDPEKMRKR